MPRSLIMSAGHECGDLRTIAHEHDIGVFHLIYNVGTTLSLQCLVVTSGISFSIHGGDVIDVLSRENKSGGCYIVFHRHLPGYGSLGAVGRSEHQHTIEPTMVLKLFHESNLRFLLNRFVSRPIFAYAECIVSPYVFDRNFHEGSDACGGFHVVAENEECAASANHAAMQCNAVDDGCHGKF